MARGIMHVETAPASPEVAAAYHEWYAVHVREMGATEGVVAVHRFAPVLDDGRLLAIYELEGDDLTEVMARIREAAQRRTPPPPGVVQTDPPATVRLFEEISSDVPAPGPAPE